MNQFKFEYSLSEICTAMAQHIAYSNDPRYNQKTKYKRDALFKYAKKTDIYPFVPTSTYRVCNNIIRCVDWFKENRPKDIISFVDLGAGIGHFSVFARKYMGWPHKSTALEINKTILKVGNKMFGNHDVNFIAGDILKHDLSQYNLIFSCHPFYHSDKGEKLMSKMVDKITKEVKVGSIIIPDAFESSFENNTIYRRLFVGCFIKRSLI